jgi:hypothetical protein
VRFVRRNAVRVHTRREDRTASDCRDRWWLLILVAVQTASALAPPLTRFQRHVVKVRVLISFPQYFAYLLEDRWGWVLPKLLLLPSLRC